MKGYEGTTPTVDAIGKLGLTGNVVPRTWFQWLQFKNGKPNSVAIMILSELCYWYRPVEDIDEKTGRIKGWRKKFKADKLQKSYQDLAESLGFTKRQVSDNIKWLREFGCITTEFRHFSYGSNILFIDLCPDRINQISLSPPDTHVTVESKMGYVETSDGLTVERDTYTEITTRDYSTEITSNQAHKAFIKTPREKNDQLDLGKNTTKKKEQPQIGLTRQQVNNPDSEQAIEHASGVKIPHSDQERYSAISPKKEKETKVAFRCDDYGVLQFPTAKKYKLPSILAMRSMQFLLAQQLECDFAVDSDGKIWISDPKDGDWMSEDEAFGGGSEGEQGYLPLKKMISILNSETAAIQLDIDWFNETTKRYFQFWQSNCERLGENALSVIKQKSVGLWLQEFYADFDIEFEDFDEVA